MTIIHIFQVNIKNNSNVSNDTTLQTVITSYSLTPLTLRSITSNDSLTPLRSVRKENHSSESKRPTGPEQHYSDDIHQHITASLRSTVTSFILSYHQFIIIPSFSGPAGRFVTPVV